MKKVSILSVCLLVIGLTSIACAWTEIAGDQSGTLPAGTYLVIGDITVPNGTTLQLDAGVVFKFNHGMELLVYGTLDANGSGSSRVVFTSVDDNSQGENIPHSDNNPNPADWDGIYLYGYSGYQGQGYFDWCRVRYAGNSSGSSDANVRFILSDDGYFVNSISEHGDLDGIRIDDCSPQITDSEFMSNGSHGIRALGNSSTRPVINDNHFISNAGNAIWLNGIGLLSYSGNSGHSNGINGMVLNGSTSSVHSWAMGDPSFPFIIDGTVTVLNGDTLSLPAGTVIKSYEAGELYVSGTLDINGSELNPVILTSIRDDSYAGDTNGDDDVSQPSPADWRGIYLYGYSGYQGQGYFDWCRVRYAGNDTGNSDANVRFVQSDDGYFINSISEYSSLEGLKIDDCSPQIIDSEFSQNLSHGVHVTGGSGTRPVIDDNHFTNNAGNAVWLYGNGLISYSGNSGSDNGINGMVLHGSTSSTHSWTMGDPSFPFIMDGTVTVQNGDTLSLPAGTVIKSYESGELYVSGTLEVNGSELDPVIFTSINDDTYAGDTNGDDDVSQPSPADWRGIYLYGYSTLTGRGYFDWCRVRYAGNSDGSSDANVRFNQSDDGYFINSISEHSNLEGVKIDDCSPQITDSEFRQNLTHGVYVNGGSGTRPIINDNYFTGNTGNAVWLYGNGLISYSGNSGFANGVNGMVLHGSTSSAHSWTMGDPSFPFIMDGTVSVLSGDTLTIPAGTVIKSYEVGELYVSGTLDVNGSEQDPVIFTSINDDSYGGDTNGDGDVLQPSPADWRGIYLYGYSTLTGRGYFDWCRVRYAGSVSGSVDANVRFNQSDDGYFINSISEYSSLEGLKIDDCSPQITDSEFISNGSHGVHVNGGSSTRPLINDNHFTENTGNAVWLDGTGLISYSGNSGAANGVNGMVLHGSTSSAHSWVMSDPSFPFIIDGTVSVLNGDTLTIPAGTVIKSYEVGELYVSGTLDVNGSEQDPVIFTSINDDTYAGDTNGDGDVSQPLPADWRGLYLYGYSTNRGQGYFEWCRVRYAGNSSGNSDANVKFVQSDSSCFYNSISEFSNMSGIWTENSALHVRNSLIENNISYGVYISGYAMPNLGANDLADRGLNRVRMNNGGVYQIYNSTPHQVPAYYNYWDGETAPEIDALLYDDNENASLGMILFDPWAVALAAPENLVIFYNLDSGMVELSWDAVPEATGYRIYSSTQPYFGFLEDESGLFDGASWTAPASDNVRFYLVRAYN